MNTQFRGSRKKNETESSQLIDEVEVPLPEIKKRFRWRKIKFVEPLPAIYIASFIILEPVMQQYVYLRISEELGNNATNISQDSKLSSLCSHNKSSVTFKIQQETQHASSRFFIYLTLVQVLLSCLPIIILGNIVDRMGRKIALYLTFTTRIFYAGIIAIVIGFKLPIYVLFIGYSIDGLSGSIAAAMMAFNTYITDVTEPGNQRSFRMTLLEAVIGLTSGVCALGTGLLIRHTSFLIPVFIALGLIFIGLLYSIFILAESYNPMDKPGSLKRLSCGIWKRTFAHYIWDSPEKRRSRLLLALAGLFFTAPAVIGSKDVLVLYVLNLPFCWRADHIGIFSAIQTFLHWIFSLTIVKLLHRFFSESGLVILGNFSNFLAYVVLAFAYNDTIIYIYACLGVFAYIALPNIRAAMSKLVKQDEQGSLFAGISFIESFSILIFEIVFNTVYSMTLSTMPGSVFFLIAGMLILTILIFLAFECISRKREKELNLLQNINS